MKVLALALLFAGPSAAAADQFDLICTGMAQGGTRMARHYRVDLKANEWCAGTDGSGDCQVRPIAEVSPDVIWFSHREASRADPGLFISGARIDRVSRVDGDWYFNLGDTLVVDAGKCELAPFSGLPVPKTQF